jgi:hypothetical protein
MFTPTMQHVGQIGAVGDTHVFGLARHDVGQDQTDTRNRCSFPRQSKCWA